MKKALIISLMVAALVCVFALPAVIAGTTAADVVTMQVPAGAAATQAPVTFPHKKHVDGGIDCLVCHHKAASKDAVDKGCASEGCHADASKAAKKEPTGYYAAFHSKAGTSCLSCHKKEKKAGKAVPVACKECHVK